MSTVAIEDFDPERHHNHMGFIDDVQARRRSHAGALEPYRVCLVRVAGFEFVFHSTTQLEVCLEYYQREHLPSGCLPVHSGQYGGDQSETQRWFERLPGRLRADRARHKVIAALEQALQVYALEPGAITGTAKPSLFSDGFADL